MFDLTKTKRPLFAPCDSVMCHIQYVNLGRKWWTDIACQCRQTMRILLLVLSSTQYTTLLKKYKMIPSQRKRLQLKSYKNLQLFVKKLYNLSVPF